MVNEITTKVLESPWYKGTDSRFYPVPPSEGLESRGYAAKAQNLIRLVHEQIKDHIFVRERRTPNYEDFFSCLKQIVQDETNDIVNPLITKNVELLKTAASSQYLSVRAHIDNKRYARKLWMRFEPSG